MVILDGILVGTENEKLRQAWIKRLERNEKKFTMCAAWLS